MPSPQSIYCSTFHWSHSQIVHFNVQFFALVNICPPNTPFELGLHVQQSHHILILNNLLVYFPPACWMLGYIKRPLLTRKLSANLSDFRTSFWGILQGYLIDHCLHWNWLYHAVCFAVILGFFSSVSHHSRPLRKHMLACMCWKRHSLRFMIGGYVSFLKDRCFAIVLFRTKIDFLILVTCKNKAMSAFFLCQKIHTPSGFPLIFLPSLKYFSAKLGKHVTLWFALHCPNDWRNRKTQNHFKVCKMCSAIQLISL